MSTYDEAVELAAGALRVGEDANWELARLTYENTFNLGDSASQAGRVSMAQWSADIRLRSGRKFSEKTGQRYKAMWAEYGGQPHADRPPWTDAHAAIFGNRLEDLNARQITEKASAETKIDVARKLLAEPAVAEQLHEEITTHVAADPKLTTDVIRKRQDAAGIREVQPRPQRDYDAMVEQFVNLGTMIAAAESSKKWAPSERSEALLYFMAQILGERRTPTGDMDDLVNQKLEDLFSEVEAYANSEAS